jgi:prevent-host-death family protein
MLQCSNVATFLKGQEEAMPVTTVSSREFNQNVSIAKRAAENGPVFITDRGEPAQVLLSIKEYRRLTGKGKSVIDLLAMPEGMDTGEDFDELIPRSREVARSADLS